MDLGLELHAQSIMQRAKRAEILANNLINADTPGFKAQDLKFDEILKQNMSVSGLNKSHSGHMAAPNEALGGEVIKRTTSQPSKDGNTVDSQKEVVQFTENAMRYQASLQFFGGKVNKIISALKGE